MLSTNQAKFLSIFFVTTTTTTITESPAFLGDPFRLRQDIILKTNSQNEHLTWSQ